MKAKLVNECIKLARVGADLGLVAKPQGPSSKPDHNAVGRFYAADGGWHITRT